MFFFSEEEKKLRDITKIMFIFTGNRMLHLVFFSFSSINRFSTENKQIDLSRKSFRQIKNVRPSIGTDIRWHRSLCSRENRCRVIRERFLWDKLFPYSFDIFVLFGLEAVNYMFFLFWNACATYITNEFLFIFLFITLETHF